MTCAVSLTGAYLVKNGSDEHIPKKPLVINGVRGNILREGKPEGLCHGAALLVGLVEGSVEVGQQLVAHLDGSPPCICHWIPQIQLLHISKQLNTACSQL